MCGPPHGASCLVALPRLVCPTRGLASGTGGRSARPSSGGTGDEHMNEPRAGTDPDDRVDIVRMTPPAWRQGLGVSQLFAIFQGPKV